jgi:hypothetical protein
MSNKEDCLREESGHLWRSADLLRPLARATSKAGQSPAPTSGTLCPCAADDRARYRLSSRSYASPRLRVRDSHCPRKHQRIMSKTPPRRQMTSSVFGLTYLLPIRQFTKSANVECCGSPMQAL